MAESLNDSAGDLFLVRLAGHVKAWAVGHSSISWTVLQLLGTCFSLGLLNTASFSVLLSGAE